MASGGILQTPTRRSAEALGRSNVVLIINARKLRWQILALGSQVPCPFADGSEIGCTCLRLTALVSTTRVL